jgi:hypothetical protein
MTKIQLYNNAQSAHDYTFGNIMPVMGEYKKIA